MDRFEAMSGFLAVAEAGSFSAAARRLALPLATLSRRVADLERHLGVRLLQRSTRRLALTDSGRAYLESCRQILESLAEAERSAAGEYQAPRGLLTVTAPIVFGRLHLLPVAVAFLAAFPDVQLNLLLVDRTVSLLEEQVDLALRLGPLPDSGLVAQRLGAVPMVTVASPGYLKRRGTPKRPEDLKRHDCVSAATVGWSKVWFYQQGKRALSLEVPTRLNTTTAEAAIDAALADAGLTQVRGYQVAEALAEGRLKRVLRAFEPPPAPVHLVQLGGRQRPAKLAAFLDFAVPRLKARIPAL